jgi:hypothetical protein
VPDATLERTPPAAPAFELPSLHTTPQVERELRDELRRQIAILERRLAELFAAAFPRKGIEFGVPAAGGPRVLGVAELENVRDGLAIRIREAETEISRRGRIEERNRARLEEMLVAPERHRWLRISAAEIGEPSCRTWTSEPRFGVVGMLMGWWRVKVSSGCPLASGRGPLGRAPTKFRLSIPIGFQIAKAPQAPPFGGPAAEPRVPRSCGPRAGGSARAGRGPSRSATGRSPA